MSDKISHLGPVDPASLPPIDDETEIAAPWIIRKLVGVSTSFCPTNCISLSLVLSGGLHPRAHWRISRRNKVAAVVRQLNIVQALGAPQTHVHKLLR